MTTPFMENTYFMKVSETRISKMGKLKADAH